MDDIGQRLTAALRDRYAVAREVGAGGMALVCLIEPPLSVTPSTKESS